VIVQGEENQADHADVQRDRCPNGSRGATLGPLELERYVSRVVPFDMDRQVAHGG
jgi:hypothetical protein